MQIGSIGGSSSLWDIAAINNDEDSSYSGISRQTTASGDSVDISDEARELYSQMIHKYDKTGQSGASNGTSQNANSGGGQSSGGGGGGAGGSESSSDTESIEAQIQSLKSQIMALATQAAADGPGSAASSQMNALQAQVAALEAQLNSMAA